MHTTNIWHKFNIHWRKVIIAITLVLGVFVNNAFGQLRQHDMNNPQYDDRLISYGFLIGLHTTGYQLKYADAFDAIDSLHSIQTKNSPGFSLGFIVNLKMTEFLDLRLLPKVAFYDHKLDYIRTNVPTAPILTETVESTVVEFPLMLKYKSVRRKNLRMYLVGGAKIGIEASGKNKKNNTTDQGLLIQESNFSLDFGFGFDIYYPLFKFSPELRFSRGLSNMLLADKSNDFSAGIKSLQINTVTLYLLFQ